MCRQRQRRSGSVGESNPPNVGVRRFLGFEDRDGHQSRIHSRFENHTFNECLTQRRQGATKAEKDLPRRHKGHKEESIHSCTLIFFVLFVSSWLTCLFLCAFALLRDLLLSRRSRG